VDDWRSQAPRVAEWLAGARAVGVLTGAGISTDSGIPDFRGPQGIWTKDPKAERLATLQHYLADPETRRRSWRNRIESPMWHAKPNEGHKALVDIERRGNLVGIVTQNVDGLHQAAGSDPQKVIEVHGNANATRCVSCDDRRPMDEALDRVRAGEEDPPCLVCGGILKSTTISFGENLVPEVIAQAEAVAVTSDVFLVAGSTLTVYPAASLAPLARSYGARVVIANLEPTAYDDIADAVLTGPLSEVLPAITG
jgi:NAD-dependent protein deacetylase/lipoamidase